MATSKIKNVAASRERLKKFIPEFLHCYITQGANKKISHSVMQSIQAL
jgi:hypothetical protein